MNELFSYVAVGIACWLARDSHGKESMLLANLVAADFLLFFAWDVIWFESNIPGGTWMYSAKAIGGYFPFLLAYMIATTITFIRYHKVKLGVYLSLLGAFAFLYNGCYNLLKMHGLLGPLEDYQLVMGIHMVLQLIGIFLGVKHEILHRFIPDIPITRHISAVFNRGSPKHHA